MNIGTKHRIVNQLEDFKFLDASGAESTTRADIAKIVIPGTATLDKANFKSYIKTAASAGTKEVSTVTLAGEASAVGRNSMSLKIEVKSSRNEAEFSRYRQDNGKDIVIGGVVAAGATSATITAELKKSLDARASRFGDLPFTYSVSGSVITITAKEAHVTLGEVELTIGDNEGQHFGATVEKAITTPGVLPVGQGSQIEENVSFLGTADAVAGSMRADERVDISAEYNEFFLAQTFSDALAAMPKEYGQGNSAGEFHLALFVNKRLATNPKYTLFESLFDGLAGAWNA